MVVRESVNTEDLNIKRPRELKFHPIVPCYFRGSRAIRGRRNTPRMKGESLPLLRDQQRERERERETDTWNFRIESNRIEGLLLSFVRRRSIDSKGGVGNLDRSIDTEEASSVVVDTGVITGRPDNWIQLRRN